MLLILIGALAGFIYSGWLGLLFGVLGAFAINSVVDRFDR